MLGGLTGVVVESSLEVFNKCEDVVFRDVVVLASPSDSMIFDVSPILRESMNLQFQVSVRWTRLSFSQGAVRMMPDSSDFLSSDYQNSAVL